MVRFIYYILNSFTFIIDNILFSTPLALQTSSTSFEDESINLKIDSLSNKDNDYICNYSNDNNSDSDKNDNQNLDENGYNSDESYNPYNSYSEDDDKSHTSYNSWSTHHYEFSPENSRENSPSPEGSDQRSEQELLDRIANLEDSLGEHRTELLSELDREMLRDQRGVDSNSNISEDSPNSENSNQENNDENNNSNTYNNTQNHKTDKKRSGNDDDDNNNNSGGAAGFGGAGSAGNEVNPSSNTNLKNMYEGINIFLYGQNKNDDFLSPIDYIIEIEEDNFEISLFDYFDV